MHLFQTIHNLNKTKHEPVQNRTRPKREKMTQPFRKELVQRITRNLLDIQILRLLKTQPMWGYKIKKLAETEFDVKLRHGALYPLLNTMERKGFITSQKEQQGGRTRKVYTMTKKGQEYIETYNTIIKEQMKCKNTK